MPSTKTRAPETDAFDSSKYQKKLKELREMERQFGRAPTSSASSSYISAEIESEHKHARGSSQKKSSSSAHYAQGGDGGDDDHYDDDDDDDGSDESDGTDDYRPNHDDDDEEEDSEDDDKPMISPVKLERSVSTKLRANIDNFIDLTMDSMGDDEITDPKVLRKLVLERFRVHDAKVHAENLFRLSQDDLDDMARNISNGMKTAIATELFNRCTKGHSIVLRKELLKDDASRETCIDHFFDDNMLKNRLHNMVKHAVKDVMNFADDIDEVRERAFGGFMRSGGDYRATPIKHSKDAAEDTKPVATRGRPRKREAEAAEDMMHPVKQPGQPFKKSPKKKRKHSRSRSRDAAMTHQ